MKHPVFEGIWCKNTVYRGCEILEVCYIRFYFEANSLYLVLYFYQNIFPAQKSTVCWSFLSLQEINAPQLGNCHE